ncbi:MAG: DUF4287 domain-containing protein [Cyclobacteriaceae bacterium]|nr:DUF4287 domain-containing protein [Cyclobacteriaceae bacterium]
MDKALQTMIDNMPEKTGKSLEEWKIILNEKLFAKHSDGVKYLKTAHNVTHGFANTIITLSKEENMTADDLITNQYRGKETLIPIYEKLIRIVKAFGEDVEIAPKKTSVSLKTKKQFALIQPSTKTRIDLGIKIKGREASGRLETSGPFGSMCTHRVQITELDQVDEEVIAYLKEAYNLSST